MPSPISSSTAVDLSRLPAPTIVAQPDFETIRTALIAEFQARYPDYSALLESDPAIKLIETFAYRELLLRREFDDAGKGLLLAYAAGANLDQLGALFGVTRLEITPADSLTGTPAVMESDAALRARIVLAPESYSVAGPTDAYNYHARSADGDVKDASTISPAPGEVLVTVLSRTGDGTASDELLEAVADIVNGRTVRPLTDQVTVQSAEIVDFTVEAQLYLYDGPDSSVVVTQAQSRLAAYLAPDYPLGRDITLSGLYAALHVEGVQRVVLASPLADIVLDPTQAARCTSAIVTFAGHAD